VSQTDPGYVKDKKDYSKLDPGDLRRRIITKKNELGEELVILAHHYQRREIIEFNDYLGDSFALAKLAAERETAKQVVFCGVRFMAEAAEILTGDHQSVFLSHPDAGCPMADMAPNDQVQLAWEMIESILGKDKVIPLVYMNSTSEMKAFCGERNGLVVLPLMQIWRLGTVSNNRISCFSFPIGIWEKIRRPS